MSVDENMVRRIANLARIGVTDGELPALAKELSAIIGFVEQLSELDTEGVKPLTSAVEDRIRGREDVVTDGGYAEEVLANAPEKDDEYLKWVRFVKIGMRSTKISDDMVARMRKEGLITEEQFKAW